MGYRRHVSSKGSSEDGTYTAIDDYQFQIPAAVVGAAGATTGKVFNKIFLDQIFTIGIGILNDSLTNSNCQFLQ